MHSQRLNDVPLESWIISRNTGEIICGHCNCMAGLAEACTHVASLLFWVEISIKIRDSATVTDKAAYWVAPSNPSKLKPSEIQDINFRAPSRKKKELLIDLDCTEEHEDGEKEKNAKQCKSRPISKPSQTELDDFFSTLNNSIVKPGILHVLPKYANQFRPKSLNLSEYVLTELYNHENTDLSNNKLLKLCRETFSKIKISNEDSVKIENKTRDSSIERP